MASTMIAETSLTERLVAQFGALKGTLPGAGLGWLARERAAALEGFAAKGLPTPKAEAWKYTNLNPLAKLALVPAEPVRNGIEKATLPSLLATSEKAIRLVLVNGRLRADLSSLGTLPGGVTLTGLAAALEESPALLEGRLGARAAADHPLVALNTAFMADGFVLRVARGTELARPIEIHHLAVPGTEAGAEPVAFHTRNLVLVEAGSRATVIEQHVGTGPGSYFANAVSEILVEAGASLTHYRLQAEGSEAFHIATERVSVGADASYDSFILADGGRLARREIDLVLDGAGASCRLDGAYMGRGRQLIDNTTNIDHAYPHTTSRETYKGALDGYARGVFQGRILVRQAAQKSDGQQTCRTLLLSEGAEIDAKPALEIYADDVKCSHGAAAGELEEDALFYLRSRGVPEPAARHMLVEAFLGDGIDGIPDEAVRDGFRRVVAGWLESKMSAKAAE
jgi:Fe-S cluster assembly protein SufD